MKSKVILFCVLLFCSKFVESSPFSEDLVIQRAYNPSIWQENRNAPGQHPNTFFKRNQNVNTGPQNDNIPLYNQNQRRFNEDSYGYKQIPITPAKEDVVNYDYTADGQRLNPYQPTMDTYPPRVESPQAQFENKNWQPQNQYGNPVEIEGNIDIKEQQPLVTTFRHPYRGPAEYQPPKLTPSSNQKYFEDERHLPREQYYQQQASSNKFMVNSESQPEPRSFIPDVNNNNAAIIIGDTKDRNSEGFRYVEPGENYNVAPTVIEEILANQFENKPRVDTHQSRSGTVKIYNDSPSDIPYSLSENSENRRLVDNYGPSQDAVRNFNQVPINTAPININNNDGSFRITDGVLEANRKYNNMNNNRPRPMKNYNAPTVPGFIEEKFGNRYGNNYKDGLSDISLVDKSKINGYGPNYAWHSNPNNVPRKNYNDGLAAKVVLDKSGNSGHYVDGQGSNAGSNKLPTVTTYNPKNDTPLINALAEKTKKNNIDNPGSQFRLPVPVPPVSVPAVSVPTVSVTPVPVPPAPVSPVPVTPVPVPPVPVRPTKKTGNPGKHIDTVTVKPKIQNNEKPSASNKPRHVPSKPTPVDRNLHKKNHHPLSFSVKDILSKAQIQSILSENSNRFLIVHPNKTVEYVDKLDLRSEDINKFHLINAKEYGGRVVNGTNTTSSPGSVPANSATPIVPADGHTLPPGFNKPKNNITSKPLAPSKSHDHHSVPSIVLHDDTSPTPLLTTTPDDKNEQPTTIYSPAVTTTPSPDNSSDIITISPIELATDNVTDITPVTTTDSPDTTTTTLDTVTDTYNKQDDAYSSTNSSSLIESTLDSAQKLSAASKVSTGRSVSVNEDGDGIVIEIMTKVNGTQNNGTYHVNNKNNSTQTATNSSLTNSDVPTTTDDYSPVTTNLSIQNDVNTGDDNSLEHKQSETDIKITLSKNNDSEDELITILIEVSESTDDEDTPDDDVLLVKIETQKGNKDDSKKLTTDDCKKDRNNDNNNNNDTNKGKNVQIDLGNIKGEPMMWFKTTNQDFMHQLMSKNDTTFDVMYFFDMHDKMIIEKDKHTTIFCNGTVVIDQTETTWQYENDPSPKIEKTTKTINIKDYQP